MKSPSIPPDKHGAEPPQQIDRGNLQHTIGIIPAARKELGNLPLKLRRLIHRKIYEDGGVDTRQVRQSGDLYRLRFSSDTRAAAKLIDNTLVILRVGKKAHVEQFYARYFRSAICRDVQDWVRLEDSGIDPFSAKRSLKSVANALTARLDDRIDAVDRKTDDLRISVQGLQDDVELLELCGQDRQTAIQELKQRVESFFTTIQDRLRDPVGRHEKEERNGNRSSLAMRTWRRWLGPEKKRAQAANIDRNGQAVPTPDEGFGGRPR